jgi:hypothetical protein
VFIGRYTYFTLFLANSRINCLHALSWSGKRRGMGGGGRRKGEVRREDDKAVHRLWARALD